MEPWKGRWRPARLGGVGAAKGDAALAPPGSVMGEIGAAVMAESEIRGGPRAGLCRDRSTGLGSHYFVDRIVNGTRHMFKDFSGACSNDCLLLLIPLLPNTLSCMFKIHITINLKHDVCRSYLLKHKPFLYFNSSLYTFKGLIHA